MKTLLLLLAIATLPVNAAPLTNFIVATGGSITSSGDISIGANLYKGQSLSLVKSESGSMNCIVANHDQTYIRFPSFGYGTSSYSIYAPSYDFYSALCIPSYRFQGILAYMRNTSYKRGVNKEVEDEAIKTELKERLTQLGSY